MYAKVFTQIFDSTLAEDYVTRHLFMDLLVLADREGFVDMTLEAIVRRINVPIEMVAASIEKLSEPDPASRSRDEDGRRIVLIDDHRDWGWKIVNFERYAKMRNEEERHKQMREYMQKRRAKEKAEKEAVNNGIHPYPPLANKDADAHAEADEYVPPPKKGTPCSRQDAMFLAAEAMKTAKVPQSVKTIQAHVIAAMEQGLTSDAIGKAIRDEANRGKAIWDLLKPLTKRTAKMSRGIQQAARVRENRNGDAAP